MNARVGLGFDLHLLVVGRPCVLGGVTIPHPSGPEGHSDGDAVLHALVDALTGAAGLDDAGTLFPDDDPRWRGVDSAQLLESVVEMVRAAVSQRVTTPRCLIQTRSPSLPTSRLPASMVFPSSSSSPEPKRICRGPPSPEGDSS